MRRVSGAAASPTGTWLSNSSSAQPTSAPTATAGRSRTDAGWALRRAPPAPESRITNGVLAWALRRHGLRSLCVHALPDRAEAANVLTRRRADHGRAHRGGRQGTGGRAPVALRRSLAGAPRRCSGLLRCGASQDLAHGRPTCWFACASTTCSAVFCGLRLHPLSGAETAPRKPCHMRPAVPASRQALHLCGLCSVATLIRRAGCVHCLVGI